MTASVNGQNLFSRFGIIELEMTGMYEYEIRNGISQKQMALMKGNVRDLSEYLNAVYGNRTAGNLLRNRLQRIRKKGNRTATVKAAVKNREIRIRK